MKVSIDGILGSASKISNDRQVEGEGRDRKKRGELRGDSIEIGNRVNSRLDSIQVELRDLQSALTRSQVVRNGIDLLEKDLARGGNEGRQILDSSTFEGKKVLKDFVGDSPTAAILQEKRDQVHSTIREEISRITRLEIEVENIVASNIADGGKTADVLKSVSMALEKAGNDVSAHSALNADTVMRLIK
ncbi:MAG: hypothetical protein EPN93_13725 [Spirochaetes bacterium]|nr:MAG: hypothetical protein EPN93_13725 [Spirochaetota bacterium]